VVVVDASVVVDWLAPDADRSGPAFRYLRRAVAAPVRLQGPPLLVQEVGNALLTGVRRGRWDGAEADRMFGLLRQMPVELIHDERDVDRAWELSRRYDEHPLYDMVYVALAERLGETMVTADEELLSRLSLLTFVTDVEMLTE